MTLKRQILELTWRLPLIAGLCVVTALAQNSRKKPESCPQPIYKAKETTHPAKVISRTEPSNEERLEGAVTGTAVLCSTGQVTDISISSGLTDGMNKKVKDAVRQIKFVPAEKAGQPVSQYLRFEFYFDAQ